MSTNEIKILLESFYDGNTNKEEEKLLIDYFNSDNVAEELRLEKDTFLIIHKVDDKEINVPPSLEFKLNKLIDDLNTSETVNNDPVKKPLIFRYLSIAACLIVLIVGSIYVTRTSEKYNISDAIALGSVSGLDKRVEDISLENREKLQQAKEAMLLVSEKLNIGMNQLAMASSNVDKTNKILSKTLKRNKIKGS